MRDVLVALALTRLRRFAAKNFVGNRDSWLLLYGAMVK
jgi:hypothetical protein